MSDEWRDLRGERVDWSDYDNLPVEKPTLVPRPFVDAFRSDPPARPVASGQNWLLAGVDPSRIHPNEHDAERSLGRLTTFIRVLLGIDEEKPDVD